MKMVRSATRALIIQNGKLLTILMRRPTGEIFHVLPGGGQQHGETLHQSLKRECREELGVEPLIKDIAYVREYIGRHHNFKKAHREFHQLEVVFECELPVNATIGRGSEEDRLQVDIVWVDLDRLDKVNLYPRKVKEALMGGAFRRETIYWGDIN